MDNLMDICLFQKNNIHNLSHMSSSELEREKPKCNFAK